MKSAGSRGIEAPFTPGITEGRPGRAREDGFQGLGLADGVSCNSIRPHDVTFPMEAGPGTVALIS